MADPNDSTRGGDLVLNGGQYAFVQDTTKGVVNVSVGPYKVSLSQTDQPVNFNGQRFVPCTREQAVQEFVLVDEGSYVVLTNPARGSEEHPKTGSTAATDLHFGKTINVPGPARFPLWPGQMTQVVAGHVLRTNQYLVANITNGDEATKNWPSAVLQPQAPSAPLSQVSANTPASAGGSETQRENESGITSTEGAADRRESSATPQSSPVSSPRRYVTGQRIVIRGTDISFFIPPTGVQVMPENRNYVRDAVTLESLQYCVLLSEDGNKRFVQGPAVVFPEPNETFVVENNERVFRAIELNPQMGIHVKVIKGYEEGGRAFKAGEELFITGREQQIYFPRPEHAIVPYRGAEQVHFAVVIPEGEGRYVLDKATGKVESVRGPKMLLCNPVTHVVVRRVLSDSETSLMFPGNAEALAHNAALRELEGTARAAGGDSFVSDELATAHFAANEPRSATRSPEAMFVGDRLSRRPGFTPPKSITLKGKYDGAVALNVWPGYAVQTVSKTSERKVVVGPANVLLDYDQTLATLELSAGTPKGTKPPVRAVYLRVVGNKVSDVVSVETSDMVGVNIRVSYRVNFEGKQDNWFALEDYVGFLTDHLRSVLRNVVKKRGIEAFMKDAVDILRDAVLGTPVDGKRPGKNFAENGMRVYDLEVLGVTIGDATIANLLISAQKDAVSEALKLQQQRRELEVTLEAEKIQREIDKAQAESELARIEMATRQHKATEMSKRAEVAISTGIADAKLRAELEQQELFDQINSSVLAREKAKADQAHVNAEREQKLDAEMITAETDAAVKRFTAMQPELVKALQALGDKDLLIKVATALKTIPVGIDEGMGDAMERMFKGTVIAGAIRGNGQHGPAMPITPAS